MDGACPFTFGRGVELGTVSCYLWLMGGVEDGVIILWLRVGVKDVVLLPVAEGWSEGRWTVSCS